MVEFFPQLMMFVLQVYPVVFMAAHELEDKAQIHWSLRFA